eukprot:CAMPEP_0183709744 /NCGR_PEP_ID=MMETSP0737-20130205/5727_1 /TAXON_ID=385413 /ORGANISM="Thalassiosira miniscula, Strain CCMP1093" /LENGTH=1527 /DNA_ID=CAMNT_0025937921 /DNA_START=98 /DNA_END=4681 /DNA_ORIENTATION=+
MSPGAVRGADADASHEHMERQHYYAQNVYGLPDHYTHDGSHNNPLHPQRGTAGSPRIREHPPFHSYAKDDDDDDEEPLWWHPRLNLPSARRILVDLFQKVTPRKNERANQFLMVFGHFIVRDITRTAVWDMNRPIPIECDLKETRGPYCPAGQKFMELYRAPRSMNVSNDGAEHHFDPINSVDEPPISNTGEPINFATTWLDMDHIYGNAAPSSKDYYKYRTGMGGQMKLDYETGLPPIDEETGLYLVYDNAMRELPGDLALTSTYLQYHNKRARFHQEQNPEDDDEVLYWKARMDVIAAYQLTVEQKYLPALLGEPLVDYAGYNSSVDASIDVFFSTCTFRYGHSGVSGVVRLVDKDFKALPHDPMLMRDVQFHTEEVVKMNGGGRKAIPAILRGKALESTKAPDASFVDDMSLFMEASVVKNIQRGRENGLPSYNDAREYFGLSRRESYLDLANGTKDMEAVAMMLEGLYGKGNIDEVDPYVGAMLEHPTSKHHELGPLNEASIREQFERLRNGDRLFYRNRLPKDKIERLPTLSQLIRDAWGEEEMVYFPDDVFATVSSRPGEGGMGAGGIDLFDGDLRVSWKREKDHIDFTMFSDEEILGYVGLGWRSSTMKGAEIWFCESKDESKHIDGVCSGEKSPPEKPLENPGPFSCCVAQGYSHVRPECEGQNYLSVLDSCVSKNDGGSYVMVRAKLCSTANDSNCFYDNGDDLEFIAAYNPDDASAAHGFSRRQGGSTNLVTGTAATCSDDSAQAGLFALHGATLLIAWLVLAPIAIYVVRYKKDKPWRLQVHITLVGVIGGLMLNMVLAAMLSVEGTSFGTEDAEASSFSTHKKFGLSIVIFVVFMIATGELRRRRILIKRMDSIRLERAVMNSHRCGGIVLVGLAWYNCWTGLIQIGPYDSDSVEVALFSSKTVALGYDLEFFGIFQQYVFFPWISIILLVFIITEIHAHRARRLHGRLVNTGAMLKIENDEALPIMSLDTFRLMTKHGSALSIIDGYVIDIGTFKDVHPGGANVMRFAVGSDITPYFLGELDMSGRRHKHSPKAIRVLRPLVTSKLEQYGNMRGNERSFAGNASNGGRNSVSLPKFSRGPKKKGLQRMATCMNQVFRSATVVGQDYYLVGSNDSDSKSTLKLRISLKRDECMDALLGTPPPTSAFIFRAEDSMGNSFERPYTPSRCYLSKPKERREKIGKYRRLKEKSEMIVYEFFITIIPGGKMSAALAKKTLGKRIMVNGPLVNQSVLENLRKQRSSNVCMILNGTCIASGLQLINYYNHVPQPPNITFLWLLSSRQRDLKEALDLTLASEATSENFTFLIMGAEAESPNFKCEEMESFLQLYYSENIFHEKTVDALISWVTGQRKSQLLQYKDTTLKTLIGIAERMKAALGRRFCGADAVSFLLDQGYTPSRGTALALARELDAELNLFEPVNNDQDLPIDDTDQMYSFRDFEKRVSIPQDLCGKEGLHLAICGHSSFENQMADALRKTGIIDSQIFLFLEGSTPLSQLPSGILKRFENSADVADNSDKHK